SQAMRRMQARNSSYPQVVPSPTHKPGAYDAWSQTQADRFPGTATQEQDHTMSARPSFGHAGHAARSDGRIEQLRVPPQSVEAEQAVLGGLMLAPDAFDRVADQIVDGDFYRRDHQLIYRAIRELAEKNRPYDAVTLGEWFESQGLSEQVAGGAYLVELASTTPSAA